MNTKTLTHKSVLLFLILALIVSACGQPLPTDTPVPTATIEPAPEETATAVPTPVQVPPTPTPQTIRLDLPPAVVATVPEQGQEQPLDAPVIVRFDQPMEPDSTAAAFAIEPPVPGDVAVTGNDLVFTPAEPLQRDATYQVSVADSAQGTGGKALAAPVQLRFDTVGFLEVTSTQPADGNDEVAVDTAITVIFNRPVVPLTGIEQMAALPQPLRFEPAVAGRGEWLNTSIYAFVPDQPLAGSTDYTVTVVAGLEDTKGSVLAEDVSFSFRTASPIVLNFEPTGTQVSPNTTITVTFSQPMDRPTTEAAFSMRSSEADDLVEGAFSWSEDDRTLIFQPDPALFYDIGYTAQVTSGARAAQGEGTLRDSYVASFQTPPRIRLKGSEPADGDFGVSPDSALQIFFYGLVNEKTLGREAFTVIPEPTSVFSYFSSYEGRWVINWPMQPRTVYEVRLSEDIADVFGNTLGEEVVIGFSTGDRKPFAHLNVPGEAGTYNAYANTEIAVSYRNVSRLDFDLYAVSEADVGQLLGRDRWDFRRRFEPQEDDLLRQWSLEVSPEINTNVLEKVALAEDGGPLAPGLYWLEMRAPEVRYSSNGSSGQEVPRHLLIVSPLNLIAKKAADEVLVWAVDLQSGLPVAALPIRVTGAASTSGNTDTDGIFRSPVRMPEPWDALLIFAGAAGDPAQPFGLVSTDWQEGLGPWEFDLPSEFATPTWQGYFYFDRPLYRPGQTVFWKGIIRADDDAIYTLPEPGQQVEVTFYDGQGTQVYQQTLETNAFGTLHGELALADEAGLGFYQLQARLLIPGDFQPIFGGGFQVAEYRKPEFEVGLSTDVDEYLQGDTINATLAATYFFGGPVGDAEVNWTIFGQDAYFNYTGEGWYSFSDYTGWDTRQEGRFGEVLTSGSGKTDRQGRLTFAVPADIGDRPASQRFTIDARIVELSGQEVSTSTGVVVHRGLIYPGVAPRSYVNQVGRPAQVDLIAVDWESQPMPGQEITAVVNKATWKSVQEQGEDGRFYWIARVEETPVLTETLTTDDQGRAVLTWTPEEGGQYKINATVTDSRGNRVRSAAFTWVSGSGEGYVSWRVDNNDRIELVADQRQYAVGDTARILVPHPYQGAVEALVTVERGGILEAWRTTLAGNSETLEIPIVEQHLPNVFVSVVVVKGQGAEENDLGSFKLGYVQLPVDTAPKELRVTLTPSQERLEPGQVVSFTVGVTDDEGNPVEGEFSLSLVDKALLSLVSGQEQTLVDVFYRQRGLGVQTSATLVVNLDRLNQQLREGAKGGGGGGADMAMFVDVRSEFEDTALWEPAVVTDAEGRAVVSVQLPDNLTTWRLDGRGITADTKVGQATVEIVTTLPLLVRPVLPRFFVDGDRAEIGAIITNNTDAARRLQVEMVASGLATTAEAAQEVTVPARGQASVTWPAEVVSPPADQAVGQATVRFTAWELSPAGGEEPLRDAVELTLPIHRYSSPETVGTAGTVALGEERLEVIVLPPNIDPTQGELQVRLEPSLAAGMRESLDWLEHFPYECNEQVVGKFLPNVVTYRALAELDLADPTLEANLRQQVNIAVQQLQQRQNPDGGWGWWPGEDSRIFVSSYVLFGLVEADKAGFSVDEKAIARGADYVARQLEPVDTLEGWELNQQAFALYVLAEAGQGDMGRTVALYDVRERLGHYGRAYLALAFGELAAQGESAAQARVDVLLDDLTGAAILSATGAHWEEDGTDWWTMNTDTRSTSLALAAMARLTPAPTLEGGLAPNVVRWLMAAREASRWETTQENVWAIIALTDWMLATGELEADYSYRVDFNGAELDSGAIDRSNLDQPIDLRVAVQDMLLDQANALAISRFADGDQTGDGQLYYTSHLSYFLPASELEALDRGIVLAREYRLFDPVSGERSDEPVSGAAVGDVVEVKLTIIAPHQLHYLVVESPLPAGMEAIDTSLATTSQLYEGPQIEREGDGERPWWYWSWIPSHSELRDEKVVLFATEMAPGTYEYTYQMRASLPGEFQTLPATAYQMYFPEVWGRSEGELFPITAE